MTRFLIFLLILGLVGCNSALKDDPASQYYLIPAGSTIKLLKRVAIPPNTAHINLQYGKFVRDNELALYYPHCRFTISDLSNIAREIKPDTFRITHVENLEYVASWPDVVDYRTKFWIHSDKSPQVLYMICSQYNSGVFPDWVTIADMQRTWGEYFTIELANQPVDKH